MIRRPPRSTPLYSSAASDVYKRQVVLLLHPNRPDSVGLPPLSDEAESTAPNGEAEKVQGLGWTADVIRSILTMGVIYFTIKFLRYALWSWAPFFLRQNFGLSGDRAGYLSTIFELCGFFGVIASGVASDKLFHGRRAFIVLSLIHISEPTRQAEISYAVFCLKKK